MTIEELEMLKFFCLRLLNDFNNKTYDMPYLKFIFKDRDHKEIITYLENLTNQNKTIDINIKTHLPNRSIPSTEIEQAIKLIKQTKNDFLNNQGDQSIYIEIPDYKEFFKLLNELMIAFDKNSGFNNFNATGLLRSIWLRMSPSDINNVNTFLKKQISFIKNDYLMPNVEIELKQINDLYISYYNCGNENWFETNRNIKISIKRKVGEIYNDLLGPINIYKYYSLPVIHYGLIMENDEPTCYIFGIQNRKEQQKDEIINQKIHEEKKRLRNKSVSPDFIIALKIFIDILEEKGITTIKVPLLQVFNYEFHQRMGKKYQEKMFHYTSENIEQLKQNAIYQNIKEQYERYYSKEDLISANKTERLLNTFYLVSEKYNNLEIITEPFIQSDTLICKINPQKEKSKSL